jgi:hypothetical protein
MRRDELFERLEPPPGGLASLRARMAAPRRRRPSRARVGAVLAFAVAAAALVLVVASRGRAPDLVAAARQRGGTPEVALGLAPMPAAVVAIDPAERATSALAEVPTTDPNVAFYWVSSTTWGD